MKSTDKETFLSKKNLFAWPNLLAFVLFVAALTNLILYEMSESDEPIDSAEFIIPELPDDIPNTPNTKNIFRKPFRDFVMEKNAELHGDDDLAKYHRLWDIQLYETVSKLGLEYAKTQTLFTDIPRIAEDYAYVVEELRKAELPEIFAAIPLVEGRYRINEPRAGCTAGKWLIGPEKALVMGLKVTDCPLLGKEESFTPTSTDTVKAEEAPYSLYEDGKPPICLLTTCAADERLDFELSTKAVITEIGKFLNHPDIKASGSAVQMSFLAMRLNIGGTVENDLVAAYNNYRSKPEITDGISFVGDNLTCKPIEPTKWSTYTDKCGGNLKNSDQHFIAKVIAQHIIVVCRLAKEHSDIKAFEPWLPYLENDQYCQIVP